MDLTRYLDPGSRLSRGMRIRVRMKDTGENAGEKERAFLKAAS